MSNSWLLVLEAFLLALLAAAAWTDLRSRKIPNVIPVAVFALCLLGIFLFSELQNDLWLRLASFGVAIVGGFGLFVARFFGGGDVKLIGALALFFPLPLFGQWIIAICLFGGLIALFYIVKSVVEGKGVEAGLKTRIPYGLAVFLGQVWMWRLDFSI